MVERLDSSRLAVAGRDEGDLTRFIESDFRIRSGLCPNGCGLLAEVDAGQACPACSFSCNMLAEKGALS